MADGDEMPSLLARAEAKEYSYRIEVLAQRVGVLSEQLAVRGEQVAQLGRSYELLKERLDAREERDRGRDQSEYQFRGGLRVLTFILGALFTAAIGALGWLFHGKP